MKKALGLVGAALLFAGPATAADLAVKAPVYKAPPPVFGWAGFYAGVNAGVGWNNTTGDAFGVNPAGVASGVGTDAPAPGTLKPGGGLFGAQAGYNFQSGAVVWGVETDLQWADIKDSAAISEACCSPAFLPAQGTLTTSQELDWFGTVRARLGYTVFDRGLLYGTAGLMYGHEKVSEGVAFKTGADFGPVGAASVRAGWTAGGGLEYAFTHNITGKIEGLYYDMGSQTLVAPSVSNSFTQNATFDYKGVLVRAGVNYKF